MDAALSDTTGTVTNLLLTKLTTNYTYFMREETHYRFMEERALPEWTRRIRDHDLRTWSAGCSSGEEAYTASMVIKEFLGTEKSRWDTTILATDISPRVLAAAKEGVYPSTHLEGLPEKYRRKYFIKLPDDQCKVNDELGKSVIFAPLNLMERFKFRRKFHIIFCRNVMIYFDNATKKELAAKFYEVLEPGGYLFIGLSETLSGIFNGLDHVSPSIYRKGH